jgi:hypothetical protein
MLLENDLIFLIKKLIDAGATNFQLKGFVEPKHHC